jgi:hypothetical protein
MESKSFSLIRKALMVEMLFSGNKAMILLLQLAAQQTQQS